MRSFLAIQMFALIVGMSGAARAQEITYHEQIEHSRSEYVGHGSQTYDLPDDATRTPNPCGSAFNVETGPDKGCKGSMK